MGYRLNGGRIALCCLCGLLSAWTVADTFCVAQTGAGYKVLPIPPSLTDNTPQGKRIRRDMELFATRVLHGEEPLDNAKTRSRFDNWYWRYHFAILTAPEHLEEWPEVRGQFLRQLQAPDIDHGAHDHLVALTEKIMQVLVTDNHHPVARYNAMLLLGQLNTTEAVLIGPDKQPPVPLNSALAIMLDQLDNPNQIDAVRVAALIGVLRHIEIDAQLPANRRRLTGKNSAAQERIMDSIVSLASTQQQPEGRTPEGHDWMRRRAVQILGAFRVAGRDDRGVAALVQILSDPDASVHLRCGAAEALGRLEYSTTGELATVEIAKAMARIAVLACDREIERAVAAEGVGGNDRQHRSPELGREEETFDPDSKALTYRKYMTRRRIMERLSQVERGLTGSENGEIAGIVAATRTPEDRKVVENLAKHVRIISRLSASGRRTPFSDLLDETRKAARKLESVAGVEGRN